MNEGNKKKIRQFIKDRDWEQFHTPETLAKSISIEAGELLECFQWSDSHFNLEHVKEELADVLIYCQDLVQLLNLDEDEIISSKIEKNEKKYPVEKCKGSDKKYNEL